MRLTQIRALFLKNIIWTFLVLVLVGFSGIEGKDSKSWPQLRVLTYNIHHGEGMDERFDYERLAKIIRDLNPDVVALQEVDFKTRRSNGIDQASLLGDLTQMRAVFGKAMYFQGGEYGEALLSRFPMEEKKIYALPYHPGQEPRAALAAKVIPEGELPEFIFVGTHLCHQSEETRFEQMTRIHSLLSDAEDVPVILAGDLNARKGSPPMNVFLKDQWKDASAPHSQIDYILIRSKDPWKVVDVRIIEDQVASDHFPVLVVLEWISEK